MKFLTKNKEREFDYIDVQIIRSIEDHINKYNHSPSTKQISELLETEGTMNQRIPPRTIRYRISKLEEKGILQRKIPITHERKLGIGESFFIVEENPKLRDRFYSILNKNSAIDWYIPTYGKYNGYYIHTIYTLDSAYQPHRIFKLLKKKKIIKDYFAFDLVDYKAYSWNFDYFNEEGFWTWDWSIWEEELHTELKSGKELQIKFDTKPEKITYDYTDIQILRNLYQDDSLTFKKLGEIMDLSESQISRRIKVMEQKGIIRGYRTGFYPFENSTPIMVSIKAGKDMQKIFYLLSKIPYPLTIAFEKTERVVFVIETPITEIREFLKALHSIKPLTLSLFIQFWPKNPEVNLAQGFDFFDKESNSWIKLDKEHEKSINSLERV